MANYKSRNGRRKGAADALPFGGKTRSLDKADSGPSHLTGQFIDIDGRIFNKTTQPSLFLIYKELRNLDVYINKTTTPTHAVQMLCTELGCEFTEGDLEGPLPDSVTTMIDNPNIENDLKGKKPSKLSAKDKFPDPDDPIYNLTAADAMTKAAARALDEEKNEDANNYIKLAGAMVRAMASTAGAAPQHQTSAPIQQKHREKEKQESRTSAPIQQKYREK